jgi:hypothetical protein
MNSMLLIDKHLSDKVLGDRAVEKSLLNSTLESKGPVYAV